jgi:hypothetical protein
MKMIHIGDNVSFNVNGQRMIGVVSDVWDMPNGVDLIVIRVMGMGEAEVRETDIIQVW